MDFSFVVAGKCAVFTCDFRMRGGNFELTRKVELDYFVLRELRAGNGSKRCAIVDIVPTGSYQAALSRIGLYDVGFEDVS